MISYIYIAWPSRRFTSIGDYYMGMHAFIILLLFLARPPFHYEDNAITLLANACLTYNVEKCVLE